MSGKHSVRVMGVGRPYGRPHSDHCPSLRTHRGTLAPGPIIAQPSCDGRWAGRRPRMASLQGLSPARDCLSARWERLRVSPSQRLGNKVSGRTFNALANSSNWCKAMWCRPFSIFVIEVLESPTRRPNRSWLMRSGRCSRLSRTRPPKARYKVSGSRFFIAA